MIRLAMMVNMMKMNITYVIDNGPVGNIANAWQYSDLHDGTCNDDDDNDNDDDDDNDSNSADDDDDDDDDDDEQ